MICSMPRHYVLDRKSRWSQAAALHLSVVSSICCPCQLTFADCCVLPLFFPGQVTLPRFSYGTFSSPLFFCSAFLKTVLMALSYPLLMHFSFPRPVLRFSSSPYSGNECSPVPNEPGRSPFVFPIRCCPVSSPQLGHPPPRLPLGIPVPPHPQQHPPPLPAIRPLKGDDTPKGQLESSPPLSPLYFLRFLLGSGK